MRVLLVVAACAAIALLGGCAQSDTPAISKEARAAGLRFAPDVSPGDRAWIEAAIRSARPEAQRLIAEIDGLVEIRTDLPRGVAIGLAEITPERAVVRFDLRSLNYDRALDRNVVVLHELGHVIDYYAVPDKLVQELDREIPRTGVCPATSPLPTGACTAVEERFADTFAKWALGGRISLAGSGYGIPAPRSIEDWGAPLGLLAARLSAS
jgi:hypothetical protein